MKDPGKMTKRVMLILGFDSVRAVNPNEELDIEAVAPNRVHLGHYPEITVARGGDCFSVGLMNGSPHVNRGESVVLRIRNHAKVPVRFRAAIWATEVSLPTLHSTDGDSRAQSETRASAGAPESVSAVRNG